MALFKNKNKKIKWYYRYHILLALPEFWEKSYCGLTTWGRKKNKQNKQASGLLRCSALYCAPAAWHGSHSTHAGELTPRGPSRHTRPEPRGGRCAEPTATSLSRESQQKPHIPEAWKTAAAAQDWEDSLAAPPHATTTNHTDAYNFMEADCIILLVCLHAVNILQMRRI